MYMLTLSEGSLTIRPTTIETCELWLDDTRICTCASASAAASLVALRRTGHPSIDDAVSVPSDIDGWRWISVARRHPEVAAMPAPPRPPSRVVREISSFLKP